MGYTKDNPDVYTSHDMYKKFINRIRTKVVECNKNRVELLESLAVIDGEISKRKFIIDKYCNKDCDTIIKTKNVVVLQTLKFSSKYNDYFEQKLIMQYLKDRILLINSINKIDTLLGALEAFKVEEQVFKFVLKEYNKAIIKAVIERAYTWNLGKAGGLYISRTDMRVRQTGLLPIDWKATMQAKVKLIEQGKKPFNLERAPDGEAFFRFHTESFQLWWYWDKRTASTPNHSYYVFKPTTGDYNIISKLQRYRKEHPEVISLYKYRPYFSYKKNVANAS